MTRGRAHLYLLAADPALAVGLEGADANAALLASRAPVVGFRLGAWTPPEPESPDDLGVLVLAGGLVRTVEVEGIEFPELLGPGDVLRPWMREAESGASLPAAAAWEALAPGRAALLDASLARRLSPWPQVQAKLFERVFDRVRTLTYQGAIAHRPRVEERLWLMLWHLADRWGRVGTDEVTIELPGLGHARLAALVGARRPTLTKAAGRLGRLGLATRQPGGRWRLGCEAEEGLRRLREGRPPLGPASAEPVQVV